MRSHRVRVHLLIFHRTVDIGLTLEPSVLVKPKKAKRKGGKVTRTEIESAVNVLNTTAPPIEDKGDVTVLEQARIKRECVPR